MVRGPEAINNTPTEKPRTDSFFKKNGILKDMFKDVIIINGETVVFNKQVSVLASDHRNFGSECPGKVYFVAPRQEDSTYRIVASCCVPCDTKIESDTEFSEEEFKTKTREDKSRKKIERSFAKLTQSGRKYGKKAK